MGTLKFNQWQNPDGTENFKCRAWVNFNGQNTPSIRASGNVSSITDGGVGLYTVNFITALPDTNYSVSGSTGTNSTATAGWFTNGWSAYVVTNTTTSCRVTCNYTSSDTYDPTVLSVAIFR
jgi:hypothetical protein